MADDPRRQDAITRLPKETINPDDIPPSLYGLAAMMLGMAGLLMRYKLAAWGGLFACLANIATMRTAEWDTRQVLMNIMISCLGLVTCYLSPEGQTGFSALFGMGGSKAT